MWKFVNTYLSIDAVKPTSASGPSARKNTNIVGSIKEKESVKNFENQSQKEEKSFDMLWIL